MGEARFGSQGGIHTMSYFTYEDLLIALNKLTPEQLKQPVQAVLPTPVEDEVQTCLTGIALDTVGNFEFYRCRSIHNNKYCKDDLIILLDTNPYGKDGARYYAWNDEDSEEEFSPIYGKEGKTRIEDQTCPEEPPPYPPEHVKDVLQSRHEELKKDGKVKDE